MGVSRSEDSKHRYDWPSTIRDRREKKKHNSNDLKNRPSLLTYKHYVEFGIRVKGFCYINKEINCLGYILSWTQKTQAPAVQQNQICVMNIRVLIVPWCR
jgi:fucose permease